MRLLLIGGRFSIGRIITIQLMLNQEGKPFPQDIECVVLPVESRGGIFISNIEAASNPCTLKKHSIGAVITAIRGKNLDSIIPRHIEYLYVPAVDSENFDISYYFDQCADFIQEERKRTNVLVHCIAGVSRSVALVIAHLLKTTGRPFQDLFLEIKSRRRIICPNSAFISQLKQYQTQLRTKQGNQKVISGSRKVGVLTQKSANRHQCDEDQTKITQYGEYQTAKQPSQPSFQSYEQTLKQNIRRVFQSQKLRPKQKSLQYV